MSLSVHRVARAKIFTSVDCCVVFLWLYIVSRKCIYCCAVFNPHNSLLKGVKEIAGLLNYILHVLYNREMIIAL